MSDQQKGYQIGAGDPVNHQYLQSHEARPAPSHSEASYQRQNPSCAAPPPPAYDPLAPDIPIGGPAGVVGQAQQYQHFPPPHSTTGEQLSTDQQFPPPPIGSSTATKQPQHFPPLPTDSAAQGYGQEYPPPATAQSEVHSQQCAPPQILSPYHTSISSHPAVIPQSPSPTIPIPHSTTHEIRID